MINEKLKPLLDDQIWHEYQVALTFFAHKQIKSRLSEVEGQEVSLDAMTPADFASQALIGVLSGDKPWDPEKYPNLLTHLFWIVKNDIRNAVRRHASTHVDSVREDDDFGQDKHTLSPLDTAEITDMVDKFIKFLEGDDELQLLVYAMQEGSLKRADIAQSLGLSASDVTNLRKRLDRKVELFQAQFGIEDLQ